jgi:hypothetical protein
VLVEEILTKLALVCFGQLGEVIRDKGGKVIRDKGIVKYIL